MKTELEDINPVKKRLKVEVDPDVVIQARRLALSELQKNAKIEGFRAGKVPLDIIEKRFGREIQQQVIENIVDQTLAQAVNQVQVRPISRPDIQPGLSGAAGSFSYTATFEVLPEIVLKDYKGFKVEKTEVHATPEEVEEETLRLQHAMTQLEPTPSETVLAEGHVATVDFKGLLNGKSFKGGDSKDYVVEIGSGAMLADFEKGLKGAKAGEERQIQFIYPQDYFNKELAGKSAQFHVKVQAIRKKNVPDLDDEFAKDLGDFKSMKEVKEDIQKRIVQSKEIKQKGELYSQILKQLIEKNRFEVPESLVHAELSHMLEEFKHEISERGQKIQDLDVKEIVREFQPEAEKRVRSFLLLDRVAQESKISSSEEEIEDRLKAIASGLNRPLPEVRAYYEKNHLIGTLQSRLIHEKALEFLLKGAKIKVVKAKNDQRGSKK